MRLEPSSRNKVSWAADEDARHPTRSLTLSPRLPLPLTLEAHILGVSDLSDSAHSHSASKSRTQPDWCRRKAESIEPVSKQLSDRLALALSFAQSPPSGSSDPGSHLRGLDMFDMPYESARPNYDSRRQIVSILSARSGDYSFAVFLGDTTLHGSLPIAKWWPAQVHI